MKLKDIAKLEETYKKETGFVYHPGSISSLSSRDDDKPEEEGEEESGVKKEKCLRCEGSNFRTDDRGDVFCKNCGQRVQQK